MKFKQNKKPVDPRYYLNEQGLDELCVPPDCKEISPALAAKRDVDDDVNDDEDEVNEVLHEDDDGDVEINEDVLQELFSLRKDPGGPFGYGFSEDFEADPRNFWKWVRGGAPKPVPGATFGGKKQIAATKAKRDQYLQQLAAHQAAKAVESTGKANPITPRTSADAIAQAAKPHTAEAGWEKALGHPPGDWTWGELASDMWDNFTGDLDDPATFGGRLRATTDMLGRVASDVGDAVGIQRKTALTPEGKPYKRPFRFERIPKEVEPVEGPRVSAEDTPPIADLSGDHLSGDPRGEKTALQQAGVPTQAGTPHAKTMKQRREKNKGVKSISRPGDWQDDPLRPIGDLESPEYLEKQATYEKRGLDINDYTEPHWRGETKYGPLRENGSAGEKPMQLTKSQLAQIIQEEYEGLLSEFDWPAAGKAASEWAKHLFRHGDSLGRSEHGPMQKMGGPGWTAARKAPGQTVTVHPKARKTQLAKEPEHPGWDVARSVPGHTTQVLDPHDKSGYGPPSPDTETHWLDMEDDALSATAPVPATDPSGVFSPDAPLDPRDASREAKRRANVIKKTPRDMPIRFEGRLQLTKSQLAQIIQEEYAILMQNK